MQTKTFSRVSKLAVLAISLIVLIAIGRNLAPSVKPLTPTLAAPLGEIRIIVASTSLDRERGLSDHDSLAADVGMLFVFERPGRHGFWMKDMDFPIDIVWISADKAVAGVSPSVSPATYPNVFIAPADVLYVLELNSGGAGQYGIATGTKLVF